MSVFENVKIAKKANILYEGHVTSRAIEFEDGSKKTLGVMLPGEYDFTTIHEELIDIESGELEVLLPAQDWKKIVAPQSFKVPANSKFKLKVVSLVDYCCSFKIH
ncbi:pyrimidine/purine nucleoside phosphorylase [Arcobacter sp.]|uniref:pyrimidine/purine nucleoside phosphorylase n=1 Tax=Arcobacter sp. TaxID=1872629 RepID=UPI003C719C95